MSIPFNGEGGLLETAGWMLVHSLWQISLIALLLSMILNSKLLKKANTRYIFSVLSIVLVAIISAFTFALYLNPESLVPIQANASSITQNVVPVSIEYSVLFEQLIQWLEKNIILISTFWILGFMLYVINLIGGFAYLTILKKTATPINDPSILSIFNRLLSNSRYRSKVSLYFSDKIITPATFGFYRAVIILPLAQINQLNTEDTEIILAHELAHILRNDFIINIIISLVRTVFYFHPAIWWISAKIENEREKATDSLANILSSNDSLKFAKSLLKIQQFQLQEIHNSNKQNVLPFNHLLLGFLKSKKQLLYRIENLLGQSQHKNQYLNRMVFLTLFLGIFLLYSFSEIIIPEQSVHPVKEMENKQSIPFSEDIYVVKVPKTEPELVNDSLEVIVKKAKIASKSATKPLQKEIRKNTAQGLVKQNKVIKKEYTIHLKDEEISLSQTPKVIEIEAYISDTFDYAYFDRIIPDKWFENFEKQGEDRNEYRFRSQFPLPQKEKLNFNFQRMHDNYKKIEEELVIILEENNFLNNVEIPTIKDRIHFDHEQFFNKNELVDTFRRIIRIKPDHNHEQDHDKKILIITNKSDSPFMFSERHQYYPMHFKVSN